MILSHLLYITKLYESIKPYAWDSDETKNTLLKYHGDNKYYFLSNFKNKQTD